MFKLELITGTPAAFMQFREMFERGLSVQEIKPKGVTRPRIEPKETPDEEYHYHS